MFDQQQLNQNSKQLNKELIQPQQLFNVSGSEKIVNNQLNNPWLQQVNNSNDYKQNLNQVEDMFSGIPEVPVPPSSSYTRPQYSPPLYNSIPSAMNYTDIYGGRTIDFSKIIMIILGLLLIILFFISAYFAYKYFISQKSVEKTFNQKISTNESVINNSSQNNQLVNPPNETVISNISETNTSTSSQIVTNSETDSDIDGLTDTEELKLKTNPYNADTDNDGLTDWAEIKLYHTNSLDSDTDSDGYKDGEEVINGYDPAKAGGARLFEVTQQ